LIDISLKSVNCLSGIRFRLREQISGIGIRFHMVRSCHFHPVTPIPHELPDPCPGRLEG
jgi:hypothetical protein